MPAADYTVTIGLEVHCQLNTRSKMFCACPAQYGEAPNTLTCPVCLGLPGALPVLNQGAIERTILAGMMLGCTTPPVVKWDRKNYFYPDMPKNYQLTQFDLPLCVGGGVPLYDMAYPKDWQKKIAAPGKVVGLTRIHLEEDVAKSTHLANGTAIDFNRAGTPLMEIVSEPELDTAEEAVAYLNSLRQILVYAGISDAGMEKGQMRCDVNISLRPPGQKEFGAKIELKNLNSISAVRRAIHFEIERQADELDRGVKQVQSTRRWDDERGETTVMRTKEDAHDYRYFPCPDLLPLHTAEMVARISQNVPESPHAKRARFVAEYGTDGLTDYDAGVLCASMITANYFEWQVRIRGKGSAKTIANLLINQIPAALADEGIDDQDFIYKCYEEVPKDHYFPFAPNSPEPKPEGVLSPDYSYYSGFNITPPKPYIPSSPSFSDVPHYLFPPSGVADIASLLLSQSISGAMVRQVILPEMLISGKAPNEIIKEKGLEQVSDTGFLDEIISRVLADNADAVAKFKAGNDKVINALKGQVMKLSAGKANPAVVGEMLAARLKE